jgi:hypothetical protein
MVCEYDAHPHAERCRMWAGKPGLTSGIATEQTYGSARLGTENPVLPAPLRTARELAGRPKEAPDNG